MRHQITFDPAEDELKDVLTAVAGVYGTTLDELYDTDGEERPPAVPASPDGPVAPVTPLVKPAPYRQWTYNRTVEFLNRVSPVAYAMCALLAARGEVTTSEALDFLKIGSLRGHLSSIGYTLRAVYGLKQAEVYTAVPGPEGQRAFIMDEPLRELFAAAMGRLNPVPYEAAKRLAPAA